MVQSTSLPQKKLSEAPHVSVVVSGCEGGDSMHTGQAWGKPLCVGEWRTLNCHKSAEGGRQPHISTQPRMSVPSLSVGVPSLSVHLCAGR